jgi:alkylation response protein AidB-like acyl-CoA dehydrogenase
MAKLFATEAAQDVALMALRIHGGAGYSKDMRVERYYRDAPLLIIGGGTNELQRLIIAKGLIAKYPLK